MANLKRENNQKLIISTLDKFLNKVKNNEMTINQYYDAIKIVFEEYDATEETKEMVKNNTISGMNGIVNSELVEEDFNNLFMDKKEEVIEEKSLSVSKEKMDKIKKHLKKSAITVVLIGGIALAISSCGKKKTNKTQTTPNVKATLIEENDSHVLSDDASIQESVINNQVIDNTNPLLSFNAEDKKILNENIYSLFKDTISKGHKVTNKNIIQEISNWTDAYIASNIENMGPDFLLKYLQTDSKDSLSIMENYLRVVSQVDSDSQVSEDSWNLSTMFANKADADLVSKYQKLVSKIVKYTKGKDNEKLKETCIELRKELEALVKDNGSRQYSNAAIIMAINESFAGANVAKVNGYANIVIPSDLRKVVYTDGAVKCIEATKNGKGTLKENINSIGGQDNVYMKAVLGLFEEIEKDMEQVRINYSNLTEEQKNTLQSEISYNSTLNTINDRILSENLLDTFVKNDKYRKLYYSDIKINSNKVDTNKKTTIVKSNSAKKINKKKKSGKKVTTKDIDKKDFINGTVTGVDDKTIKTDTKAEQLLVEQANNQGYSDGYTNGNTKGSQGKDKSVGHITVPGKFSSNANAKQAYINNFKSGFTKGYSDGYSIYKENKDYKKVTTEESKTVVTESEVKDVQTLNDPKPKTESNNVETQPQNTQSNEKEEKIDDSEVYDVEELPVFKTSAKIEALQNVKKYIQSLPEVEDVDKFLIEESVNIK